MTDLWIAPEQLFDGQNLHNGLAVRVVDGRVTDLAPAPKDAHRLKGCLTPGYVDLQVNGGGGVLLNSTPTRQGIEIIAEAHRRFGTVAIMPTVITDEPDVLDQAADAAITAIDLEDIVGLHIEGPHISQVRRGTHNGAFVRALDDRTLNTVSRLRQHGVTVMITVAPEAATPAQIGALTELGAIVSIGHTNATAEEVEAAIKAGATGATHLFNAMSPMTGRAPGAVGAIINSHVRSGIICDGHHVDDRMIRLAMRARPAEDLMFLVSDAMATVGGPDHFDLYGQGVHLEDGRLINAEGNLAGAHVTQAEGVARLVQHVGATLQEALRMAITTPSALVGLAERARIVGQRSRDLIVISADLSDTRAFVDATAELLAKDAAE